MLCNGGSKLLSRACPVRYSILLSSNIVIPKYARASLGIIV
ncbi:MAG: hypothetical protein SCARUB_00597 [Candidatus Scalindua rubra]|uniref:Uncharacterized protein n=1 Tax=Candidatus Scalindua rubra TaxID=1872076 RepID=A0A1E3XF18_9BACT|nr:MAG: hypothetical protein SCARUB_00597 [Candidatus Scalindua rubra]